MSEKPSLWVVGQEADLLDGLEQILRRDFLVLRVGSAEEALSALGEERPQVLVSDERLPGRSGLEFLGELRISFPDVSRVLVPGFASLPEVAEATRSGLVHAYVVKPVDPPRLQAAVAEARARQERGDWQT